MRDCQLILLTSGMARVRMDIGNISMIKLKHITAPLVSLMPHFCGAADVSTRGAVFYFRRREEWIKNL